MIVILVHYTNMSILLVPFSRSMSPKRCHKNRRLYRKQLKHSILATQYSSGFVCASGAALIKAYVLITRCQAAQKMSRFQPNDCVLSSLTITRTAYAQLMGQKFHPPKAFGQFREKTGSNEWRWRDIGMKLVYFL